MAVFYATVGLLFERGRVIAAEKLKGGDVTDQQFRNLIVREINEIQNLMDWRERIFWQVPASSKKDLSSCIKCLKR